MALLWAASQAAAADDRGPGPAGTTGGASPPTALTTATLAAPSATALSATAAVGPAKPVAPAITTATSVLDTPAQATQVALAAQTAQPPQVTQMAQSPATDPADPTAVTPDGALSLRPRTAMRLPLSPQDWRASATPNTAKLRALPEVRIIELPPEPVVLGPPPKRAHHALSISMDAPRKLLRELGLAASECATRLRMPSKLGKNQNGSTTVEVTAHIGMGCRF